MAGVILLAICFSSHFFVNLAHKKNLSTLARLHQEQTKFGKEIHPEAIVEAITIAEVKISARKRYIESYLPLAIIFDLCHFTPDHIQLASVAYVEKTDKDDPDRLSKKLMIEGQVAAHPYRLDSELGTYILKLSESPVFGEIKITSKKTTQRQQEKLLLFKATLEVSNDGSS